MQENKKAVPIFLQICYNGWLPMIRYKANLKEQIHQSLMDRYPLKESQLHISYTPQAKMGDFALPFPLQMAKEMKRHPRELATEIVPLLSDLPGVDKIEVAGPGFINLFLNRRDFFLHFIVLLHLGGFGIFKWRNGGSGEELMC